MTSKRARTSLELSTRNFAHRRRASEIYKKLDKHNGCVNTVSFNANGNIVASGSDDRRFILWDWETGSVKLSFTSGHYNNVFQAGIVPYTNDRNIVICAADGQFDLRRRSAMELFTCQPTEGKRRNMPFVDLFTLAGVDEYTCLYDTRKYRWDASTNSDQPTNYFCPQHLIGNENVGITGLPFSDQSELLVSFTDEDIYFFTKDMVLGSTLFRASSLSKSSDSSEKEPGLMSSPSSMDADDKLVPQVYKGHRNYETVNGVSFFGPRCEYVVIGSDCGCISVWKKKG